MAGNTRGKLKEHFEGIHRNFDWQIVHIEKSLNLIAAQLQFTDAMASVQGDAEKEEQVLMDYPLYKGLKSLATGIQTLDGFTQDLYRTL